MDCLCTLLLCFQACDEAIEKLSLASNNPQASLYGVVNQILYPLVQGCESKDLKIIKVCTFTCKNQTILLMFITPNFMYLLYLYVMCGRH